MEPKYIKVKQEIKSKILDGTLIPHQKINSESELMEHFSVSRHTVRLAISELVNEGWVYRKQGAGTFCADRSASIAKINNGGQKKIAIITTYISNYIFTSIIQGAESVLNEKEFQVSLYSTQNDPERERSILEAVLSQNFDGIIVEATKSAYTSSNINYYFNLERLNIPYVMINTVYEELDPICLVMDDEKGGFSQTEHLINLGHTNIVGIFKNDDLQGVKRMKGYIKAHRSFGIPINSKNIITYTSEDKFDKPIQALGIILEQSERPTALVCYNDELAIILLDILREKKINIPKDMSVVGYDDSFLALASEVKLTTIKHPKNEMGVTAAKMLVQMVLNEQGASSKNKNFLQSITYEPEIVIRSSTAPVKRD